MVHGLAASKSDSVSLDTRLTNMVGTKEADMGKKWRKPAGAPGRSSSRTSAAGLILQSGSPIELAGGARLPAGSRDRRTARPQGVSRPFAQSR